MKKVKKYINGDDHARADSVEHWAHRNLKQGERIKVGASEDAKGHCIEPQILDEIWSDHRIGDPKKL